MNEVLSESIHWLNLPFTLLLAMVVLYWCMVLVGVVDLHTFEGGGGGIDAHADVHADFDAHADVDADAHPFMPGDATHLDGDSGSISKNAAHHGGGMWMSMLSFLNVGQVPVMFVLSVLALCLWLGSMLANHYFTGWSAAMALIAFLPNLVVSVIVTRYLTMPFKPLFRVLTRERDERVPIVGQRCTIVTSEATPDFGQAEIKTEGAPLLLNVRTMNDARCVRGEVAIVVRSDNERGVHYIAQLPPQA